MSKSVTQTYNDYIKALKGIASAEITDAVPPLLVLDGPSDFLRMRAVAALRSTWIKLGGSEPQQIEAQSLEPVSFRSLWSQVSLFDPDMMYVLRRCDKHAKLAAWLKEIRSHNDLRSHVVLEFSEKVPAETLRQVTRLEAVILPCVEPSNAHECARVAAQLAKREGIILAEDALRLLLDSMGPDLGRLNNEVQKICLVFHGRKEPLRATDISSIVGALREDHVFELFQLLRGSQRARAQLLIDHLLERGEKSIALTGILSRYARDLVAKDPERGIPGLQLCAEADILLKSSRTSESAVLGRIVDVLAGG